MKRSVILPLAICTALVVAGCATGKSSDNAKGFLQADGSGERDFRARSISFQRVPAPKVREKKFKSTVTVNIRSNIKSYRFKNYMAGKKVPESIVTLAMSGMTAGLAIYNSDGQTLAEFPKGQSTGNAAFFQTVTDNGMVRVKWFFGHDFIMSVFESYSKSGSLGSSETTLYTLE